MISDMSMLYTRDSGGEQNAGSADVVEFLTKYFQWPVITLGPN